MFSLIAPVLAQATPSTVGVSITSLTLLVITVVYAIRKEGKDFLFGCLCIITGVTAGASGGLIASLAINTGDFVLALVGAVTSKLGELL